jgi:enoyl-CoA hydratase
VPYQTLTLERHDRVLLVRLTNPPRNLLDMVVVDELAALVRSLRSDPQVRCVVITGDPHEVFAAHFDVEVIDGLARGLPVSIGPGLASVVWPVIAALDRLPGVDAALQRTPAAGASALLRMHRLFNRMGRSDVVFVAAVNGMALGGGLELALACDLRVMSTADTTCIGLPEGLVGILPGGGGTQRLTRAIGPARALRMMLEGTVLSPAEALELGLVQAVVPADRLLETAMDTAARAAQRSPWTVAMLKRSVYGGVGRRLEAGLRLEQQGLVVTSTSAQGRRGMRALLDRFPSRSPVPARELLDALAGEAAVDLGDPEPARTSR